MKKSLLNDGFFNRLETLSLYVKKDLSGYFGGKNLVSTYGQTVEFADFREYRLGDDIRRIDWNLYSRFEKYFLKLFTDERQMQVQIFLDCSASMGKNDPQKAAFAEAVAAAIGFLAVQNTDKVVFERMRGEKTENPFGTLVGKNAFFRAVRQLEETEYDGETDIEKCVVNCPDTTDGNGLSIVISDFFTDSDWKKAVDYLLYKHRQVILLQVVSPEEEDPTYDGRFHLIDAEADSVADDKNLRLRITRSMLDAYADAMRDLKEEIRDFCVRRGAEYLFLRADNNVEKALFAQLLQAGVMS